VLRAEIEALKQGLPAARPGLGDDTPEPEPEPRRRSAKR
jgi:hypothetical protein